MASRTILGWDGWAHSQDWLCYEESQPKPAFWCLIDLRG